MTVLSWDKPQKIMSVDEWKKYGFEEGPPGGYVSNMSNIDMLKWKAKLINKDKLDARVEIRKSTMNGTQICIVVTKEQFKTRWSPVNYGDEGVTMETWRNSLREYTFDIKMSMNGSAFLTMDDMEDLFKAIEEAKEVLTNGS